MTHTQNNLYLYVKNTGELYPQRQRIEQLLAKSTPKERKTVGHGMFVRLVQDGEKRMQREFSRHDPEDRPERASKADIDKVAAELLREFEIEHKLGNIGADGPKLYMGRTVK